MCNLRVDADDCALSRALHVGDLFGLACTSLMSTVFSAGTGQPAHRIVHHCIDRYRDFARARIAGHTRSAQISLRKCRMPCPRTMRRVRPAWHTAQHVANDGACGYPKAPWQAMQGVMVHPITTLQHCTTHDVDVCVGDIVPAHDGRVS